MLKTIAVIALLSAAFFSALPWIGCTWSPLHVVLDPGFMGLCTFGVPGLNFGQQPVGVPAFNGPYWGNLLVSLGYLGAALYVAISKRF